MKKVIRIILCAGLVLACFYPLEGPPSEEISPALAAALSVSLDDTATPAATPAVSPTPDATPSVEAGLKADLHTAQDDEISDSEPDKTEYKQAEILIGEADLPAPGKETFEWAGAGSYPSNPCWVGSVNYVKSSGLVISASWEPGPLVVQLLDGSGKNLLDNYAFGTPNYYGGWIYYLKSDGIWKVLPDGKEKQCIIAFDADNLADRLFIYGGQIYCMRTGEETLARFDLEGGNAESFDIPKATKNCFFENGYFYYGAAGFDERWNIMRLSLKTGKSTKLINSVSGRLIVRGGMAYYLDSVCHRTNGKKTEYVGGRTADDYNMYRNYLLYFSFEGMFCAFNADTGVEYELFDLSSLYNSYDAYIHVMQDCVLLYTGDISGPVYRVTLSGGKAQLWELGSLGPA